MNLTLIFVILCLTVMVVVQHWALEDQRNYAAYWYKRQQDTQTMHFRYLNSPLHYKMQKAYRSQLKRSHNRKYFLPIKGTRSEIADLYNRTIEANNVLPCYKADVYPAQRRLLTAAKAKRLALA